MPPWYPCRSSLQLTTDSHISLLTKICVSLFLVFAPSLNTYCSLLQVSYLPQYLRWPYSFSLFSALIHRKLFAKIQPACNELCSESKHGRRYIHHYGVFIWLAQSSICIAELLLPTMVEYHDTWSDYKFPGRSNTDHSKLIKGAFNCTQKLIEAANLALSIQAFATTSALLDIFERYFGPYSAEKFATVKRTSQSRLSHEAANSAR